MIKKVNWNAYIDNLQLADCSYNLWTPVTIETEANNLVKAMKNALFKSSFSVPLKAKNARWWNQELNSKWLEVNKLNREFLHSPNASRKANYRSAKKQLMKDIRFCLHEDEDAWPPIWTRKQFSSFVRKAKLWELNHSEFPSFTIH